MNNKLDISVVVPLYNEAESLPELVAWIDRVAVSHGYAYEVILVDDGSSDGSWEVVESLREKYPAIRGIGFARNYGKSAALYCGFAAAEGEVVITMDADLQDSPDEIPELRRMILEEGYDLVSGWKKRRHDPVGKRWPSKFFNWTARTVSGIKLHDFNCGLKAYPSFQNLTHSNNLFVDNKGRHTHNTVFHYFLHIGNVFDLYGKSHILYRLLCVFKLFVTGFTTCP